jgi:NHL repeat
MRNEIAGAWKVLAMVCALLCCAMCVRAQVDADLTARRRLFPEIGPGLKAIKRGADGKIYVLASPSPGLVVFSGEGRRLLSMREAAGMSAAARKEAAESGDVLVGFGDDFDVDSAGNIYVADRANNAVQVYSGRGQHLLSIHVNEPISVAALPEGEVAVTTLNGPQLMNVFDKNGNDVRDFGEPEDLANRADLNRFLNIGQILADDAGHLYYAFEYFPEPTVKQFDRFGYAGQEIQYTELGAYPEAQAVRREIARQDKRNGPPNFKPVLTAFGVQRDTGEIWMAMGDKLLHFDRNGERRATYLIYTPQNARLEANTIVVEKDRLLIGGDPEGIYEFERKPD